MALVVGSTALKALYPELGREPNDLDFFRTTYDDVAVGDSFTHPFLDDYLSQFEKTVCYANPDELYTIKVSHAYWEIRNQPQPQNWNKHLFDIIFLQQRGAVLLPELHDILYKVWEEIHGKKKVNLNMTADDFFTEGVKRIYDHDSIHDSVAYGDHALYEDLLQKDAEVAIDHRKMWEWPHDKLVFLFREEVAATALERLVIPSDYRVSPGYAWVWALRRTITSLTKGKSARFIVENIQEFTKPDAYVQRHLRNSEKLVKL